MSEKASLAAVIDGQALDEAAARALWTRFSRHMDEHQGDFDGFARLSGWVHAMPEFRSGQAVLVVWTKEKPKAPPPPPPAAKKKRRRR